MTDLTPDIAELERPAEISLRDLKVEHEQLHRPAGKLTIPKKSCEVCALVEAVEAAFAYRIAEERADSDGGWARAQEAAVVLDAALARFSEEAPS